MAALPDNVDGRFLACRSDLLLCGRCFRLGRKTPVPQAISPRHRPVTRCRACTRNAKPTR